MYMGRCVTLLWQNFTKAVSNKFVMKDILHVGKFVAW